MYQRSFIVSYFTWHYGRAFAEIWNTCTNYIWAVWHFFSVPLLFKTFFSPWRKLDVGYGRGLDIENFIGPFIVNSLMRLVGMILRAVIICIGLLGIVVVFLFGIAVTVVWIFLPVIIVYLIWQGFLKI
jgi:hypothetical protein